MCPIVGFKRFLVSQSKIGLVDQSGALQGMPGALAPEMVVRDLAKLLVDKRNQVLKSPTIPGSPSHQEFAYGLRRHVHKSLRRGIRQTIASLACQVNPNRRFPAGELGRQPLWFLTGFWTFCERISAVVSRRPNGGDLSSLRRSVSSNRLLCRTPSEVSTKEGSTGDAQNSVSVTVQGPSSKFGSIPSLV